MESTGSRVVGKKAFVTGSAQGLGAADAVNTECGAGTASAHALYGTYEVHIDAAASAMGGLAVRVNNAGVPIGQIGSTATHDWPQTHAINLDSVFFGTRGALAIMRDNTPGSVNISSIAGLIASHAFAGFNSLKAAAWMLTKSIALHCRKEKIDGIGHGSAQEREAKLARQIPLGRIAEPDDIAFAVLYLASDESRMMTGAEIKLDGGISAM